MPAYNFALNGGQQLGVPAPIASVTTTLAPLIIMVLASIFLKEVITPRKAFGLAIALVGMVVISQARHLESGSYGLALLLTTGAPLSWATFSVLSKPMMEKTSPLTWSYLATGTGGLFVFPLLPDTWPEIAALDASGWFALMYLTLPCTVLGFAVWTWLLAHLQASTVGLTVFFNPPLTTVSKWLLATLAPATFAFSIHSGEWIGGLIVLVGLATGLRQQAG